ncbi:hypothetical protein FQB35_15620 (plasmid) [Crassaminicella thermophila]|uniref:Uncharacterized protein n=2 Tax=Crassaminicella thermophila TaxID=2599308 RepID=A0A5C0SH32_CRATE|nr:hypothetical protein FQB35_15620 [Crassaminicella thermophila]
MADLQIVKAALELKRKENIELLEFAKKHKKEDVRFCEIRLAEVEDIIEKIEKSTKVAATTK